MTITRRELIQSAGAAALGSLAGATWRKPAP